MCASVCINLYLTCLLCRHEDLLSVESGVYAAMWAQQQTKLAEDELQSKTSEPDTPDSAAVTPADAVNSHNAAHLH